MAMEVLQNPTPLVAAKTGLHLRDSDAAAVTKAVLRRVRSLGLSSIDDYLRRLMGETPEGDREAREPDLLALHAHDRILRCWSAGCATGEEPYSLAILLRELIPDPDRWDIRILGADIQETFLEMARSAVFGDWSFRAVPPEVRDRWFTKAGGGYRLDPGIQGMVRFRLLDLLRDPFPNGGGGLSGIDLLLCRNLFIYYDREIVGVIAEKLARSLREGGYLMMGHGELFSSLPSRLSPRIFPESTIYQRKEEGTITRDRCRTPAMVSEKPVSTRSPRPPQRPKKGPVGKGSGPGAADRGLWVGKRGEVR